MLYNLLDLHPETILVPSTDAAVWAALGIEAADQRPLVIGKAPADGPAPQRRSAVISEPRP